jgi:hypothetical protein
MTMTIAPTFPFLKVLGIGYSRNANCLRPIIHPIPVRIHKSAQTAMPMREKPTAHRQAQPAFGQ